MYCLPHASPADNCAVGIVALRIVHDSPRVWNRLSNAAMSAEIGHAIVTPAGSLTTRVHGHTVMSTSASLVSQKRVRGTSLNLNGAPVGVRSPLVIPHAAGRARIRLALVLTVLDATAGLHVFNVNHLVVACVLMGTFIVVRVAVILVGRIMVRSVSAGTADACCCRSVHNRAYRDFPVIYSDLG
jgi:hypothetical protein